MTLILSGTEGVSDVDGTAATPAVRGSDINTGIFFPAADTIAFATAGSERARIISGGNFGIGTTSPNSRLDVDANVAANVPVISLTNSANWGWATSLDFRTPLTNGGAVGLAGRISSVFESSNNYALTFNTTASGANAERARFNSTGALVFAGGDTAANGIGITFPATQSASTNANTLDDYEEGTWTPSLGGTATYTTQSGTYTKVGRVVTVLFELTVNTLGTGSTTTISGLPFTNGIATPSGTPGATAYFASLATNVIALTCYAAASTTQILFNSMNASGSTATNNPAIFGNSTRVQGSVTYFV
jgi:hypothetical protein